MSDELQKDLFTKRHKQVRHSAAEIAVHCMIADTLRIGLKPGWVWFHPPNGGWRSKAEAGKFKRMGVKEGVSDFILFGPPSATLHALELKKRGEKPSDAQLLFMGLVQAAGGKAEWCDDYKDAIRVLTRWECLKTKVTVQ